MTHYPTYRVYWPLSVRIDIELLKACKDSCVMFKAPLWGSLKLYSDTFIESNSRDFINVFFADVEFDIMLFSGDFFKENSKNIMRGHSLRLLKYFGARDFM